MRLLKNEAEDKVEDMAETARKTLEKSQKEMKKSGKDWLEYIQSHPAQSILFGLIGYYALKGLLKD